MSENETLRKKVIEIDSSIKSAGTGGSMSEVTKFQGEEIKGLKLRIKLVEQKNNEELRLKELEYARKISHNELKYQKREQELRRKIKELEESGAVAPPGIERSGSLISKSSRTPSPNNVRRLLGGQDSKSTKPFGQMSQSIISKPLPSRENGSSARVSEVALQGNIKTLESMIQKVMDEYRSIKSENRHVSTKLDKIEKVLYRLENNYRTASNESADKSRHITEELELNNRYNRHAEDEPYKASEGALISDRPIISSAKNARSRSNFFSVIEDAKRDLAINHAKRSFQNVPTSKQRARSPMEFMLNDHTSQEDEDRDEVVYRSGGSPAYKQPVRGSSQKKNLPDPRNLTEGFDKIAPTTWTNQYNTFIDQITRMKSELLQLGEENEDLVSLIQN